MVQEVCLAIAYIHTFRSATTFAKFCFCVHLDAFEAKDMRVRATAVNSLVIGHIIEAARTDSDVSISCALCLEVIHTIL